MYRHSDFRHSDSFFPFQLKKKKSTEFPNPKMKLNKIDTSFPVQVL